VRANIREPSRVGARAPVIDGRKRQMTPGMRRILRQLAWGPKSEPVKSISSSVNFTDFGFTWRRRSDERLGSAVVG
jgi:hypothetical protein